MACVITVDGKSYDETGFKQMLSSGFLVNEINAGVLKDSKSEIYKQYVNGDSTKETARGEGEQALQEGVAPEGEGTEIDQAAPVAEAGNQIPGFEQLTDNQKAEFDLALASINEGLESPISAREAFNKLVTYIGPENFPFITNMKSSLSVSLDESYAKNILKGLERDGKTQIKGKFARTPLGRTLLGLAASMRSLGASIVVLSDEDFNNFLENAYGLYDKDRNAIYAWGAKTMVLKASNSSQVALHEFTHPILEIIEQLDDNLYNSLTTELNTLKHPGGKTYLEWAKTAYAGASNKTIINEALTELISNEADNRIKLNSPASIAANRIWNAIMSFFGIKGAKIDIKIDNTLTVDKLSKAIALAVVSSRALKIQELAGVEQTTAEGIASSKGTNLVSEAGLDKYMTEDGKGNYVFYHVSGLDLTRKGIDPNKLGSNARTGRDEVMAKHPVSMYYTEPDIEEVSGSYKHVVLIPKDKVYPIDSDPLNLRPLAEKEFRKVFPNISFDNNRASSWIAKVAAEKGYDIVVANWSPRKNFKALRAESAIKHKPDLYRKPKPGSLNAVTFNEKYEFESNRGRRGISSSIDRRLSQEGVAVPSIEKIPKKINPEKEAETMKKIDKLLKDYKDALKKPEQWVQLMSRIFSYKDENGNVLIPKIPVALSKMANSETEVLKEILKVSDKQRELASEGLKATKEIGELYKNGKMDEVDTGLYFLWNIMSIGISPYPQEAGFLRAVNYGIDSFIGKASKGSFLTGEKVDYNGEKVDSGLADYYKWVDEILPTGVAGSGSKANLRSFGSSFLSKASEKITVGEFSGLTKLQALHKILSDRTTPTNKLRRKWLANLSGMSFNNKIFDFILLTTGRSDLFVIDRVRTEHFWDADNLKKTSGLNSGTSIYDGKELKYGKTEGAGYSKMLSDVSGLIFAELANRTMQPIVESAYKKLGVTESPDVGRFHWETWVAASSQEVSHGSIDAIVQRKSAGEITDAGIRQGKYGSWDFNFSYKKRSGRDFEYEFTDDNGNVYVFDNISPIYEEISNQNTKKNYETNAERFILKDQNGDIIKRKTEKINEAWYDQPGVDKQKYFEFLASKAKEVIPAPNVAENKTGVEKPSTKKGISSSRNLPAIEYVDKLKLDKSKNKELLWSVSIPSIEDVKKGTIIEDADGAALVDQSGDIRGVYKFPESTATGVSDKLLKKAIEAGGIKLDNFDIYLTKIYKRAGFNIVSRVPFNKKYAPEGWSEEKNGTPDVVAMIYDPQNKLGIEEKKFEDYDEAIAYRDSYVDSQRQNYPVEGRGISSSRSTNVTSKFAESAKLFDQIQEADGSAKKRRLAEERRALIESSPEVKFIDDNIKKIYEQLENKGILKREGNCP